MIVWREFVCTMAKQPDTFRNSVRITQRKCVASLSCTDFLRSGRFFNESSWYAFNQFPQSDASSGVGCDFYFDSTDDGELGAIMNIYYRNTTSLELQQSWWSYMTNAGWNCESRFHPYSSACIIGEGFANACS